MRWRRRRLARVRRSAIAREARFIAEMDDAYSRMAEHCRCCLMCSPGACDSVFQGAPCEQICRCGDEDAEDAEGDYFDDDDNNDRAALAALKGTP